jgi:hypothetical protein
MAVSRRFASQIRSWDKMARILLVLLILTSFAAVQAASAIEIFPDHHHGPNDRCCAGGHAGHFPVLVSVSAVQIHTLSVAGWRTRIDLDSYTSDDGRTFNSSRAPPA